MKPGMAMGKDAEAEESSAEDDLLGTAYDAITDPDGDRESFVSAMRSAIRACMAAYDESE